jgi:alpha,alpha-trehalase
MTDTVLELASDRWKAVIFDLDGVITRTAAVHAAAWKQLFDDYLKEREAREGEDHSPFDIDRDYRSYVDGKPRYDGVRSFLESRGIDLPWGDPEDPPDRETVCGLGNRKNRLFNQRLKEQGADVFPPAVELVKRLRAGGVATAVVSSSKNTGAVLDAAGIADLFDARVDGIEAERLGLTGKPAPDVFVEAAGRLGAEPGATVVFEDAVSGVEAGRRGSFGLVVGVDRVGAAEALREAGAHEVLSDLSRVAVNGAGAADDESDALPSALEAVESIVARGAGDPPLAVFLDYDGTLTPIVELPEDATLAPESRDAVAHLAELCPVAVISGRDLEDVRGMVGLETVHYAGSHGYDISGPEVVAQRGTEYLPDLEQAQRELEVELEEIPGAWVERKKFAVAIHFRQADEDRVDEVRSAVERAHARRPGQLEKSSGKKIFELRPAMDWNKGRALSWIMEELGISGGGTVPLYLGDDTTDEDAFREIGDSGVGIVVGEHAGSTAARYRLRDPDEVRRFLLRLAEALEGGGG